MVRWLLRDNSGKTFSIENPTIKGNKYFHARHGHESTCFPCQWTNNLPIISFASIHLKSKDYICNYFLIKETKGRLHKGNSCGCKQHAAMYIRANACIPV